MNTVQMQQAFMYDKDTLTPDEAVELLSEMFESIHEVTPTRIRTAFNLKGVDKEESR